MEALSGGEAYIFHARIVCENLKFGVKLALRVKDDEIEFIRHLLLKWYDAKAVYLSYENPTLATESEVVRND